MSEETTSGKAATRGHWAANIVPVLPIVLSVLVALAVYWYSKSHPFASHGKDHDGQVAAGLKVGEAAPAFSLLSEKEERVSLADLTASGPAVIVFYKGYACPRCVMHLREIADRYDEFGKLGAQVAAISVDPPKVSADKIDEHGGFPFPLLADPMRLTAGRYGVYQGDDKDFHGLFVVSKDGKTQFAYVGEHPFGDVDAILKAVIAAR